MAKRTRIRRDERPELSEDDKILREAKDRFKRCEDWESEFQTLYKDDVKFANADSDNGWQWPQGLKQERDVNKRPSLTINKVAQKCNLIVNDARKNKASVTIKPVGDQTNFRAAQIYEGVVRHIEYVSKAQAIYDEAMQSTVEGGIGWWRVGTQYDDEDSFDQSIVILPIRNQLGVYLDPDRQQPDGSDAKYGFVFDDVPKDDAENDYPDVNFTESNIPLSGPDTWVKPDNVRIAEYYRIVEKPDTLVYMEDDKGNAATFLMSTAPSEAKDDIKTAKENGQEVRERPVKTKHLEWFKIAGNKIVDRRTVDDNPLKGRIIPLVYMVGQERVIDGKLYRKGHVRDLKDPQRMYNYNSSGQVEYGALQTKTPWVGPKEAFEGNEDAWNRANVQNAAYLTYNGWDVENDRQITPPAKPEPPGASTAFVEGMRIADHEMDMVSGQYEAMEGRSGNERSGKAIQERQRPGETSTYHFVDHQAIAIRKTGMIILDMFPHVYDTERVIQIMGKDGTQSQVTIKPDMAEALEEQKDKEVLKVMFNPKVGKYMVEADVGPAYGTQRQEAWNAFVNIVTGAPDLINEIGDLMFRSADFPLADKIAERLMRKIKAEKPFLFDDEAPTPQMQALQQEVQALSKEVEQLLQTLAENRLKLVGKEQKRDIEAFRAESQRVKDISNAQLDVSRLGDPEVMAQFKGALLQALDQMVGSDITGRIEKLGGEGMDQPLDVPDFLEGAAAEGGEDEMPPVQGAQKAPDGNWYVPNPEAPGKYMLVQ